MSGCGLSLLVVLISFCVGPFLVGDGGFFGGGFCYYVVFSLSRRFWVGSGASFFLEW
jgi:hypothetical protein